MNAQIVCIIDENTPHFFAIKNSQWPFERLKEAYAEGQNKYNGHFQWRGHYYWFKQFIEDRGAVEIELPTLNIPDYQDLD